MAGKVFPTAHTRITAELLRKSRQHASALNDNLRLTGQIIFHLTLPAILSNATDSLVTSGAHIDYEVGNHDMSFEVVSGPTALAITYAASNDPCFYLITESLLLHVSDAVAGDIYNVVTKVAPDLASIIDTPNPPFSHFFMQGAGETDGVFDGESSMTTLAYFPAESAEQFAAQWMGRCQASAGRHLSSTAYYFAAFRFEPFSDD